MECYGCYVKGASNEWPFPVIERPKSTDNNLFLSALMYLGRYLPTCMPYALLNHYMILAPPYVVLCKLVGKLTFLTTFSNYLYTYE